MTPLERQLTEIAAHVLDRLADRRAAAAERATGGSAELLLGAARHLGLCADEFVQDLAAATAQPIETGIAAE